MGGGPCRCHPLPHARRARRAHHALDGLEGPAYPFRGRSGLLMRGGLAARTTRSIRSSLSLRSRKAVVAAPACGTA